jgi:HSP20 family protein
VGISNPIPWNRERTVALPCEVEADQAAARYRNGVLHVTLPKAPEARRHVHRIEVKSA